MLSIANSKSRFKASTRERHDHRDCWPTGDRIEPRSAAGLGRGSYTSFCPGTVLCEISEIFPTGRNKKGSLLVHVRAEAHLVVELWADDGDDPPTFGVHGLMSLAKL